MDYSLDNLSALELKLYNSIPNNLNFGDNQLEVDGTFAKYRNLHVDYFQLLITTSDEIIKLEALKRLIFLSWYSYTEPSIFNGIESLKNEIIFNSYSILNDYIRADKLDEELEWMLKFYANWDWAILDFSENRLSELTNFVKTVDTSISTYPKQKLPQGTMSSRGQMGLYWISMQVEIEK
ncbi:MAG: hypothetical protein V4546_14480 [Bacteroidota bacterium]